MEEALVFNMTISRERVIQLGAPAPDWLYFVRMPNVAGAGNSGDVIAEQISFPHKNIPANPRFGGATNTYYPGTSDVSSASISFYETEDYIVTRYLKAWQRLVKDENDVYGMPIDYKKNIMFELYSREGRVTNVGILIGAWPTNISNFDVNYASSGKLTVSCNFSIDDSEMSVGGGLPGVQTLGNNLLSGIQSVVSSFFR